MQSSSDKPKPSLGLVVAVAGVLAIGAVFYVRHHETQRTEAQQVQSAAPPPGPYSAEQEKSWENSVEHATEVITLHAVDRPASDVYVGADKDGKQYHMTLPDSDDAYECGVIAPADLTKIVSESKQWKGTPQDIPAIRKQAAKPILLEQYKPIDGREFWQLTQGDQECDVDIKH